MLLVGQQEGCLTCKKIMLQQSAEVLWKNFKGPGEAWKSGLVKEKAMSISLLMIVVLMKRHQPMMM